jgi:hypothetical protein
VAPRLLLSPGMKLAAAALVLLSSSIAAAFPRTNLRVGASVVASATVSVSIAPASRHRVEVHASAGRTPAPAVVVGSEMKLMSNAAAHLRAPASGDVLVTVLY